MKLLIEGAIPTDQLVFKLKQDGEAVNIYANDELIGYFSVYNGKMSLDLVGLTEEQKHTINTDDEDFMAVVR
jgi:hypothetical protein